MAPKLFVQPPRKSLESASYVLELFSLRFRTPLASYRGNETQRQITNQRDANQSNAEKFQRKGAVLSIPKCSLDAPDVVLAEIPLGNVFLADGNTIPFDPQHGRVGTLIKDKGKG